MAENNFSGMTKNQIPNIIRLLEACYRQGVMDAYNIGDLYKCNEFIEKTKNIDCFSLLSIDEDLNWMQWRTFLINLCFENKLLSVISRLLFRIDACNGYWYSLLIFCQQMYSQGIKDFIEYPDEDKITIFRNNKSIFWIDNSGKFPKINNKKLIGRMYKITLNLSSDKNSVRCFYLDAFCQSMILLQGKRDTKIKKYL